MLLETVIIRFRLVNYHFWVD